MEEAKIQASTSTDARRHERFRVDTTGTIATAGLGFPVTVTAVDDYNNPVLGYSGTVMLRSTDGAALSYTFTPADKGVHTFTAGTALVTVGRQTITASDTVTTITASAAVVVKRRGRSPGARRITGRTRAGRVSARSGHHSLGLAAAVRAEELKGVVASRWPGQALVHGMPGCGAWRCASSIPNLSAGHFRKTAPVRSRSPSSAQASQLRANAC